MKKSELYAKYYLFGEKIEEIKEEEFFSELAKSMENDYVNCSQWGDGETYCHQVRTDGMIYYMFVSSYGNRDSDSFFCKVRTLTKAEIEEIDRIVRHE